MVSRAILLDRTSVSKIRELRQLELDARRLHWDFYSALEQQRTEKATAIQMAILRATGGPLACEGWKRVVDYHHSLHPLSAKGSVLTDPGGRFNIGDLDPSNFAPFPALYLASDHETALAEKFGIPNELGGLAANDYALRPISSYSCLSISGNLESILDLRDPEHLKPLVEIIKHFEIPPDLQRRAKALGFPGLWLVRSAQELVGVLTESQWRIFPMQFDVPATSQIFGRMVMNAGVEAILYPSSKTNQTCIAVFPQKIGGKSYLALDEPVPREVVHRRLDADTFPDFV